jgi:hypothetical protein
MYVLNGLGLQHAEKEMEEDEMAKRRAAFLLKQQRKAEESRLRKQTQEAENELKRDEARYYFTVLIPKGSVAVAGVRIVRIKAL